jgi:1-acyl-sn-glycerol-3-phosphate acyltransferase
VQNQVPVLPLVVNGSREALQAGSWRMNVTEAEVRVLDPIPTEGLTKRDVPALRDRVRGLIADELAAMRA